MRYLDAEKRSPILFYRKNFPNIPRDLKLHKTQQNNVTLTHLLQNTVSYNKKNMTNVNYVYDRKISNVGILSVLRKDILVTR